MTAAINWAAPRRASERLRFLADLDRQGRILTGQPVAHGFERAGCAFDQIPVRLGRDGGPWTVGGAA